MLSSDSEISSVAHQPSCIGVGFSLCWLLGACFFALPPCSGARSVISQLAPCCQSVVMVCWLFLNFAVSFDFGCFSLAQLMNFVECYLPGFRAAYHCPTVGSFAFPHFVYWMFTWRLVPCPSPLLQCTYSTPPHLLCVSFQFLVYFSIFYFFCMGQGVSLTRVLCWIIPGVAKGILWDAWCLPVGLLNVSQVGLVPASGGLGALLFFQFNMA
jgi:hypothetical protein